MGPRGFPLNHHSAQVKLALPQMSVSIFGGLLEKDTYFGITAPMFPNYAPCFLLQGVSLPKGSGLSLGAPQATPIHAFSFAKV